MSHPTAVLMVSARNVTRVASIALPFLLGTLAPAQTAGPAPTPGTAPAPAEAAPDSHFRSAEDGWLDVSGFLDETYGFLPVLMPITEPAIGYGVGGGLLFIDQPLGKAQYQRPNITSLFGFATENGTTGGGIADIRNWRGDSVQTLAAMFTASVNLDFYGLGDNPVLEDNPLRYELEPLGGILQAKHEVGDSRFFLGLGYCYFETDVAFRAPPTTPGLPDYTSQSTVGGLLPSLTYDTRDNVFTPINGLYVEASMGVYNESLGADVDFERWQVIAMYFRPIAGNWYFGLNLQGAGTVGDDVPFYMQPYVSLRGAPAMRYQGEQIAQAEAEVRWQFWKRFSLVGFAGTGKAWSDVGGTDRDKSVVTGGTGFRYEMARKYGIHMGMDLAFGPDDTAIYIQVGSAWMRP